MTCSLTLCPPYGYEWRDAFGWAYANESEKLTPEEYNWVVWNNIANVAGYILSPIIGLIRIIVNAYFLCKNEDIDGEDWSEETRGYFYTQIGRGCFELVGGGYLLWIVDLIETFELVY